MSLSVKNGGIGKSPAISRINRLSPEKESKEIAKNMRRAVQPMQAHTMALTSETGISGHLWDPSVSPSLNPCYPAVSLKADQFKSCASAMIETPLEELRGRIDANKQAILRQAANKPKGRFSPALASGVAEASPYWHKKTR
jgi:hypothetical protein